ncbi:MAG: ABC transporter permease subunit, partial [Eubacterium sp.]
MLRHKDIEPRIIGLIIAGIFFVFMGIPMAAMLWQCFWDGSGLSLEHFKTVFTETNFGVALVNSLWISGVAALLTTGIASIMAYALHYSRLPEWVKRGVRTITVLPMLLPTITYGFAIMYSFGKQGMLTPFIGGGEAGIYGIKGLLLGYVIYTLPISFLLINNTLGYIDKRYSVVSRVMGDSKVRTLWVTVARPMTGTLAISFIQCFFLAFTDYGIPASLAGRFDTVAITLYNQMLGSVPDFGNGAVVALTMLLPSLISIVIINTLERYNMSYSGLSQVTVPKNSLRDIFLGAFAVAVDLALLSIFAVILIIPALKAWPYDCTLTLKHYQAVLADSALTKIYLNSLWVAVCSAVIGVAISFGAAVVTERSVVPKGLKNFIRGVATMSNTLPGMVLGIAFMLSFKGSILQNTFAIVILSNMVHFFATPYMMAKNALSKMDHSWESTARLMGDS